MNLERTLNACRIASNPHGFTAQEKSEAEDYLNAFKKSSQPYAACFQLLNFSSSEPLNQSALMLMHFMGVSTLREAILREWSQLQFEQIQGVAEYAFKILPNCNRVIANQLARLMAIIAKREQAIRQTTTVLELLYSTGLKFLQEGDVSKFEVSHQLFSALLCEYSAADQSSNISLTWEKHFSCKKKFQATKLKEIFEMVIMFLCHHFHERFSELLLSILNWDFVPKIRSKRAMMANRDADFLPFKPSADWKSLVFRDDIMQAIFKFAAEHPEHTTFGCLQQLASTQGVAVFGATGLKEKCPKQDFVNAFLRLLVSSFGDQKYIDEGPKAYGLALAISNIVSCNVRNIFKTSCSDFAEWLVQVSCYITKRAAHESGLAYDQRQESKYEAAWNEINKIWLDLNTGMRLPQTILDRLAEDFLRSWLAAPEGFRPKYSQTSQEHRDEDAEEAEPDDKEAFNVHFTTLANLMRSSTEQSGTTRYFGILTHMISQRTDALEAKNCDDLDDLYEDLHFLVIISGYFLADQARSETSQIPFKFHKLTNFAQLFELVNAMVKVSELTNRVAVSPVLVADLCWFWERFSKVYLLFWTEGNNKKVGRPLVEAFAAENNKERLTSVCECIFKTVYGLFETSILKYSHEELVCVAAASMVNQICISRCDRIRHLEPLLVPICSSLSENIAKSIEFKINKNSAGAAASKTTWIYKLSPKSARAVITALIQISFSDLNVTHKYWGNGEQAIFYKFSQFLTKFPEQILAQSGSLGPEVISDYLFNHGLVDFLIGCAESIAPDNAKTIYELLSPFLKTASQFILTIKDARETVNLILEFLNVTSYRLSPYLRLQQWSAVNHCFLQSLEALQNNLISVTGRDVEEENFQDLIHVMDLLENLLTNGICELDEDDLLTGTSNLEVNKIMNECGDTMIYGVTLIIPIMSESLLELPALSSRYYRLLSLLCEIHPDKVLKLRESTLQSFNYSLQLALNADPEAASSALDAICELADGLRQTKDEMVRGNIEILEFLKSLIKPVFDTSMIYSNGQLGNSSSKAFYAMFKCNEPMARACLSVLEDYVNRVQDPNYKKQVESGLGDLVKTIQDTLQVPLGSHIVKRNVRASFNKAFDKCVAEVAPILVVK